MIRFKKFVSLIIFASLVSASIGQGSWSYTYDLDGGNDSGSQVLFSGGTIVIQAIALCGNDQHDCAGFVSLDTFGFQIGKAVVHDTLETNWLEATAIRNDTVFVNMYYSDGSGYTVVMFNLTGSYLGQFDYYVEEADHLQSGALAINDSTVFVVFGYRDSMSSRTHAGIRAYDKNWNAKWMQQIPNEYERIYNAELQSTVDGGVVVSYATFSDTSSRSQRVHIRKYSSNGSAEWLTTLSHTGDFESNWSRIDELPDGSLIGTWPLDTFGTNITVLPNVVYKISNSGELEWERLVLNEQYTLYDVFATRNGEIIGCGFVENWLWPPPTGPEYRAAYVIKLNAVGEKIWDRKIEDKRNGAVRYHFISGLEMPNGDLVLTGDMTDTIFGTPDDPSPGNIWVVKLDSTGCFYSDCGDWQDITTSTLVDVPIRRDLFVLYPNPAKSHVYIGVELGSVVAAGDYHINIYSSDGKLVYSQIFDANYLERIDLSHLSSNFYSVVILRDGYFVQSGRIVVY